MTRARNLSWSWQTALFGALSAVPAAIVTVAGDPSKGLALAVGVLSAVASGVAPRRPQRLRTVIVGAMFAVFVIAGSLLSTPAWLAVIGMFVIPLAAAMLASKTRFGVVIMTLGAPLIAVGLSYDDVGEAAGLGALILIGSLAATLLSLAWPEREVTARTTPRLMTRISAVDYGTRMGSAASLAAAISFAVGTDHPGWAPAAALFVFRPQRDMQELRSWGRVISVFLGALLASSFLATGPSKAMIAASIVLALLAMGGLAGSRWYVTPLFTTFIVIQMLLTSDYSAAVARWRFAERVGWTIVGVGLAYLFGLVLPSVRQRTEAPNGAASISDSNR